MLPKTYRPNEAGYAQLQSRLANSDESSESDASEDSDESDESDTEEDDV
jgi:hypothetical protein